MPTYTLPDLLGAVRSHLAGHADVAALVSGRVHALRMPKTPVYPLVLLTSVVESPLIAFTDRLAATEVQVECYGADAGAEYAARTLAATCHAALHDMPDGVSIAGVETVTGLQPIPDVDLDKARWLFEVRVFGYSS